MVKLIKSLKKIVDLIMFYLKKHNSSANILLNEFINSAEGKKVIDQLKKKLTAENIDMVINEVFDRIKIKIPTLANGDTVLEDLIVTYVKKKIKASLLEMSK